MKLKLISNVTNNQNGFVLATSMLVLMVLTLIGISATTTTITELQIAGNDRFSKEDFYNQEASLVNGKVRSDDWLPTLLAGGVNASFPPAPTTAPNTDLNGNGMDDRSDYIDSNGNVVGSYKVRRIENPGVTIAAWDDVANYNNAASHPANQVPILDHTDKPPVGSGYSAILMIARYAITSYSNDNNRNTVLQEGAYKVYQQSNQ